MKIRKKEKRVHRSESELERERWSWRFGVRHGVVWCVGDPETDEEVERFEKERK